MQLKQPSAVKAHLLIQVLEDGRIGFQLPDDTLLCYGLLEIAKDQVRERQKQKEQGEQRRIAIATALPGNGHA